jgi:RNA-binding protein 25
VTNSATARFVRGGRHEYEATERAERLFREREKVMDDLVGANVRERARRAKIEKEKKMERRAAIKRDLASDSEEDGIQTPLWEKSDRERARRRRFRDLEIEDDERDRRDEEEELERRDTRATVRAAAHSRSTSDDVHAEAFPISKARKSTHEPERVRGFAEPRSSDLVSVPPPPQQQQQAKTSFGLTAPKRPTGGLSAAFSASHAKPPPDVFEDAARDVDRRRAERRPVDVAAIIATVPTARDDIFAHPMDWSTYTTAEIDAVASKWISKKLTDLLGESEPALARFVLEKLDARVSPLDLIVDLDPVLDAECETFVISLWRLLIFEINKATMSS